MQRRYPPHTFSPYPSFPKIWMMTDERMGEQMIAALHELPKGAGVIFRHYHLEKHERHDLFLKVRRVARARRLYVIVAGNPKTARAWGACGSHGRHNGATTAPVHNLREIISAERAGAKLLFVSPLYATSSHPSAKSLGHIRFAQLVHKTRLPVIALGGMNERRARGAKNIGISGWAGIDAFTRQAKRD